MLRPLIESFEIAESIGLSQQDAQPVRACDFFDALGVAFEVACLTEDVEFSDRQIFLLNVPLDRNVELLNLFPGLLKVGCVKSE